MDASQYHANGLSNNNNTSNPQQYSSLPGIAPHQLQHNSNLPAHTLPPLQNSQHAMQSIYGSAPHTPRTPTTTPGTPGSTNNMGGNFPQMGGQQQQQRGYQMMPGNSYQQQHQQQQQQQHQQQQQYRSSGPMMPQSSTAMSHPQPIAPAPIQNRGPQTLRPMPPNGLQQMHGMSSAYGQGTMMLQDLEPPTHVVGSQGRRGILPSAPGRPPPAATGTGSTKNTMIPAKDADGKFPCPHCTKTYLHAKHLKRHLLRHTGDRPYMCVLCRDTFSRSDILKRHFQKCSIRRGNPTGASHLSHAQAHLKKSHPGPHKAQGSMGNENDMMGVNGMNNNGMGNMGNDPSLHPFGVIPDGSVPDAGSNLTDEQAGKLARSNGMNNMGGGIDRRSMTGAPGGSNRPSFEQQGYAASTMPTGMNPPFNMPNGQNGHSYSQGYDFASHGNGSSMQPQSSVDMSNLQNGRNVYQGATAGQQHGDWSQQLFPNQNQHHQQQQQQQSQGYMNPYTSNLPNSQVPIKAEALVAVKSENPSLFSGVYPGANALSTPSDFPTWNFQNDPLQEISSRLLFFCFPDNQVIGRSTEIRSYLSSDNIKHFLEQYSNFQGHFPLIHMPTFRIAEAYDGLLLGMICVGAVYSDRMQPGQVRDMMEFVRAVLERNSSIFASISQDSGSDAGYGKESAPGKTDLEQLLALVLMHILFVWHGTPVQREKARRQFPLIVALGRKAGLTTPITTASPTSSCSALHQRHVKVENFNSASFDWSAWVDQEKRSRLMYAIYLTDCSMVIYFNATPIFEALEVRVPLPADDAAWDARTAVECAEALGLHGPVVARNKNQEGSRRPKQPEMHSALETLMRQDLDLQPGTTNLYSKFILIHALQVQLWISQKQLSQAQMNPHNLGFPASGSSTPLSQNDWVVRGIEGAASGTSSGRATPDAGSSSPQQLAKDISIAFEKWKKVWDEDMVVQYPPSSTSYRRFGFCRDGVHFYWLGKYLMKNNRGTEWQMAPDQRFSQIIHLLKFVKGWVHSDSAKRGEELGSINDIDSDFGVRDLTLDMSQLFKSINKQVDSPVMGVHTGGNTGT